MVLLSSLSLQRAGPGDGVTGAPRQVGLQGAGPLSHPLVTEIFILWEYYFGSFSSNDLHATYCQKECEMIYNKTCLKQDS